MWSRKFLWKITIQGCREILKEDSDIKSEDKDHQEELNMMIYSYLLLSMEYTVFLSIVDMERSTDHLQGLFRIAFKELKEKFEYTSQDSHCEIKLEFESMKIRNHEDPEILINTMEKLSRRMNE